MRHASKRIRECGVSGKIRYGTENEALLYKGHYEEKFRLAFTHYFCKFCGGYHLSRLKRRRKKHEVGGSGTENH